jgi:hypothetical protein
MTKDFITKDSGKREQFKSGMVRDIQEDKPRFDLIIPENLPYDKSLIYRWAMLMTRGAKKYGDRNWEKAQSKEEMERFKASAIRHFMQWFQNEQDEDHASAVCCNLMGYEYVKYILENRKI